MFQPRQFLISCLIAFVSGRRKKNKRSQGQDKPHATEFDTRSDTVITSPPYSCYKPRCIKINIISTVKTTKTKSDKLKALNYMAASVCVRACADVRPPCDSLDELEIYNAGFYSKPQP